MNIQLKQNVETLINEINKTHKYSMSRIYGLYNEVFGLSEAPQSCASCLIRKVNELRMWLEKQNLESTREKIVIEGDTQTTDIKQKTKKPKTKKKL